MRRCDVAAGIPRAPRPCTALGSSLRACVPTRPTVAVRCADTPQTSAPQPQYGGWCPRCRTTHSLAPDAQDLHAAAQLREQLDSHKRFDYEVPAELADPAFSTDYVWTKGPGRMLGVMIARPADSAENSDTPVLVLKAFSGQMTERWEIPGWAGPVAGITSTSPEYTHARTHIESITTQMRALDTQQGLTPSQAHSTADAAVDTDTAAVSGAGQGGGKGDKDVVHKAVHGGAQGEGEGDKAAMRRAAKRARFQSKSERERSHWPEGARDQYALLASQRAGASYDLMGKVQASYQTYSLGRRPLSLQQAYTAYMRVKDPRLLTSHAKRGTQIQAQHVVDTQGARGPKASTDTAQQTSQAPAHADTVNAVAACSLETVAETLLRFPAGTGDCCAPKLLHAAYTQGLVPLSMCEFWYGSPPSTNTPQGDAARARRGKRAPAAPPSRVHGSVYGACDKCQTILGAMLCPCA